MLSFLLHIVLKFSVNVAKKNLNAHKENSIWLTPLCHLHGRHSEINYYIKLQSELLHSCIQDLRKGVLIEVYTLVHTG
jgi:5-keto 4-deoxyuronate isomerase